MNPCDFLVRLVRSVSDCKKKTKQHNNNATLVYVSQSHVTKLVTIEARRYQLAVIFFFLSHLEQLRLLRLQNKMHVYYTLNVCHYSRLWCASGAVTNVK